MDVAVVQGSPSSAAVDAVQQHNWCTLALTFILEKENCHAVVGSKTVATTNTKINGVLCSVVALLFEDDVVCMKSVGAR